MAIEADVVVIGGGSTGAGVARDAAMRGYSVVLVDRADLAQGTSGRFHGLLHSGGRYVVSDPESARECAVENEIVSRINANAVELTGGLFVCTPGDDEGFADQFLAGATATGVPAREIGVAQALRREPRLNPGITRAIEVSDASVDGWALVWGTARSAVEYGAKVLTYHQVTGVLVTDGQVRGVVCLDLASGEKVTIEAGFVINAGGPWAGQIAGLAGCHDVDVVPGRGVMVGMNHRLVNTVINRCVYPTDGDILVPVHTICVIGTTDTAVDDPDNLAIPRAEVDALLDAGEALVPGFRQTRVLHAWAGARPLIRDSRTAAGDTRHMSRTMAIIDHQARDGVSGLLTIAGGKLTTYRLMAENVVDAMEAHLGTPHPCRTADEPVPEASSGHHVVTHRLAEREAERSDDARSQIVCECELVTRRMLESVMTANPGGQFDDWRRQLRIGMGPCQGGFCGLRMAGIAVADGVMDAPRAKDLLKLFLQHRWAGLWPTLSGAQARQAAIDAAICGNYNAFPSSGGVAHNAGVFLSSGGVAHSTGAARSAGVVVVGAGLAGLVTSTALARDGFDVTCVTFGVGGLPLSPGVIDVYGSIPDVHGPLEAVAQASDGHPYAAIGADAVKRGLDLLLELAGPELLTGRPDINVCMTSAVGAPRPTCLYPPSMANGLAGPDEAVFVGFTRLKDFYPQLISTPAAMIDVTPRPGEADSSPMVFARFFDTDAGRRALVEALRPVIGEESVGLPAVLGLDDVTAWRKVQDALGRPVFEVPMTPPSVPGWRLNNALVRAAQAAGVRFRRGVKAVSVQQDGGRATGVVVASAGHPSTLAADAVVLATGGLQSGGIVMDDHQQMSEPVMGLPLGRRPEQPFMADLFAPQPAYLAGVGVDAGMRPLDDDGRVVCGNVHAVGGLLAGSIRWSEMTSGGIDVGSAVAAADAIKGELS